MPTILCYPTQGTLGDYGIARLGILTGILRDTETTGAKCIGILGYPNWDIEAGVQCACMHVQKD